MLSRFEKSLIYHQRIFAFLNEFQNLDELYSRFSIGYYITSSTSKVFKKSNKIKNLCFGLGVIVVSNISVETYRAYAYTDRIAWPRSKGSFRSNKLFIFWYHDTYWTDNRLKKLVMSE